MESNQVQEGQKITSRRFRWRIPQLVTFSLLAAWVLGTGMMPFTTDYTGLASGYTALALLIIALASIFFDAEVWRSRTQLGYTILRFLALTTVTIATLGVLLLVSQTATYVISHFTVLTTNNTFITLFGVSSFVIYIFGTAFITGAIVSFIVAISSRRMRKRAKFFTSIGFSVGLGGLFLHIAIQVVLKDIGLYDIFNATDGLIVISYFAYFLIGWIAAILGAHFGGFLRLGELSLPRLHISMSRLL